MPDRKTILFTVGTVEHPDDYDNAIIDAARMDTGERRTVLWMGLRCCDCTDYKPAGTGRIGACGLCSLTKPFKGE